MLYGINRGQRLHCQAITAPTYNVTTKGPRVAKANDNHWSHIASYTVIWRQNHPVSPAVAITVVTTCIYYKRSNRLLRNIGCSTNASWLTPGLSNRVGRGTALMFHNAFSTPCSNIGLLLSDPAGATNWNTQFSPIDVSTMRRFFRIARNRRWQMQKKTFYWKNKTKWRWEDGPGAY